MAEASERSLRRLEGEVGDIDAYVMGKLGYESVEDLHKAFMALQVDSIASFIHNTESKNQGVIIADQTGVGKGRQAAGAIRYAIENGRVPVFVTQSDNLFTDMYNDLVDIGYGEKVAPFLLNANTYIKQDVKDEAGNVVGMNKLYKQHNSGKQYKAAWQEIVNNGALPEGFNALFVTYSQFDNAGHGKRPVLEALKGKAVYILDEAHNAAGDRERWDSKTKGMVSTRGGYFFNVIDDQPVMYLSATYAKRTDNYELYYRTAIINSVDRVENLTSAIKSGGIPLQTIFADALASEGQLFRRERSFEGIDIKLETIADTPERYSKLTDQMVEGIGAIIQSDAGFHEFMEEFGDNLGPVLKEMEGIVDPDDDITSVDAGGNEASKGVDHTRFNSVAHNYTRQFLFAMKADSVVDRSVAAWRDRSSNDDPAYDASEGRKVMVAFENTMGSFIDYIVSRDGLSVGDPVTIDYRDILLLGLERSRMVNITDSKGKKKKVAVPLDMLPPSIAEEYRSAEATIRSLDLGDLPVSPVDRIMQGMRDAGMVVDELTGRNYQLDYSGDVPTLQRRGDKNKRDKIDAFNNDQADALLFNAAGATGLSAHASEKFTQSNHKPRHMIVAQPMQDINTLVQALGRINRTGQVRWPTYEVLALDVPAEKRPMAKTAKNLKSLNANTTASDESDIALDAPDMMNKYGDRVAFEYLNENPEIAAVLGVDIDNDGKENTIQDLMEKVTGRMGYLLPETMQVDAYQSMEASYNGLIEHLNAIGQNDLVKRTLDLEAKIRESKIVYEGSDPNSSFAGNTTLHKVDAKKQGKPPTRDEVQDEVAQALDGLDADERAELVARELSKYEEYKQGLETKLASARKALEDARAKVADERAAANFADEDKRAQAESRWAAMESKAQQSVETAQAAVSKYEDQAREVSGWVRRLKIGSTMELDLGDGAEPFIVTGVKVKDNVATGNPYAPSKVEFSLMTPTVKRRVTLPLTQLMSTLEKTSSGGRIMAPRQGAIEQMFENADDLALTEQRETRFIATGNLIMGMSELASKGARPQIVGFTAASGKVYQGILLPSNWGNNGEFGGQGASTNVPVRDLDVAERALTEFGADLEPLGGLFDNGNPQVVRVTPDRRRQGFTLSIPSPRGSGKLAKAIRFDKDLQSLTGEEFAGKGSTMSMPVTREQLRPVLEHLSKKHSITLYALPSARPTLEQAGLGPASDAVKSFEPLQAEQERDDGSNVYYSSLPADANAKGIGNEAAKLASNAFLRTFSGARDGMEVRLFRESREAFGPGAPAAKGAFDPDTNTLFLFTGAHDSTADLISTLQHEVFVHKGLGFLSEADAQALLESIQENAPKSEALAPLWADVQSEYSDRPAAVQAEELLAKVAEGAMSGLDKFLNRILVALRKALRSAGMIGEKVGMPELRREVYKMAEAFREGKAARQRSSADGQVYYSLDEDTQSLYGKLGLGPREKKTFGRKVQQVKEFGWGKFWHERVFDGLMGIKWAEDEAGVVDPSQSGYVAARLATGVADVMSAIMRFGAPEWRNGILQEKENTSGLLEVFSELGSDLNDWLAWMAANRADRLLVEGRERNLSVDEIEAGKALSKGREELFESVKAKYNAINTAIVDVAEGAGLIDPETRVDWDDEWYVPFYRVQDEMDIASAPRMYKGVANQSSGIKQLRGSDMATTDLLENILTNFTKLVDASMKNAAMLKTVDNLSETEFISSETWKFRAALVPRSEVAKQVKKDQALREKVAEMLGMEPNPAEVSNALFEVSDQGFERLWALTMPKDKDVVAVRRDGRMEFYKVHDARLLRAVTAFSVQGADQSVMRGLRSFKRLLTTGVTTSPDFMARNFVRDAMHAWTINPDGFQFLTSSLKGMKGALDADENYRELMFAGAAFQGGYVHGTDPEAGAQLIRRSLRKYGMTGEAADGYVRSLNWVSGLEKAWEGYRNLGDKVENANRLATFKAAKEAGKSDAQAVFEAKDLMDYSLRGNLHAVHFLVDTVPFMNARIQGLAKLVRAYRDDPSNSALTKIIVQKGAKIAFVSMMMAWLNEDDERYQALPDWDKDANWHFWVGDSHFRVPKPFELGIVFGTIPERMYHHFSGSQPKDKLLWSLQHATYSTLALNPLPQAVLPAIEIMQNRSFFFDSPIENLGDRRKLPEAAYDAGTSYIARMLSSGQSRLMEDGLSPKQIEHLWRGYTGTMGMYVLSAADVVAETLAGEPSRPAIALRDMPVVKSFYGGEGAPKRVQWTTDLYDRLREVQQIQSTINDYIKNKGRPDLAEDLRERNIEKLRHRRPLSRAQRRLAQLRKKKDLVMRSREMSRAKKRERLDAIDAEMNEISARMSFQTAGDF